MKSQTTILIVVAIVIVVAVAFFAMRQSATNNQPTSPSQQQSAMTNPTPAQSESASSAGSSASSTSSSASSSIELVMNAQNASGETGKAILTDVDGKTTKVELQITGQPQGVSQPAHIHVGSCANLGAVKYPLTFPMNGTSVTTLNMPLSQLLGQLPLAINVHKSSADIGTYVSCGDIVVSGAQAQSQSSTGSGSQSQSQTQTQPAPSSPSPPQSYPKY